VSDEARFTPSESMQASLLHAICGPCLQNFLRTYRAVSKLVTPPQVLMVAVPGVVGVHE
jgi:hypothetical protein